MEAKLIVSFDRLNEVEYLAKSAFILDALTRSELSRTVGIVQVKTTQGDPMIESNCPAAITSKAVPKSDCRA
jgi:hypothetical protein